MNWLKEVVPLIGTVLGGPAGALVSAFGGVAASFVADKLGIDDKSVASVTNMLQAGKLSPDQIVKLKEAEIEFEKFCQQNAIDLEKIAAADRDSARRMQMTTQSSVPGALTFLITGGFFGILGWMLTHADMPHSEPLLVMLGSLGTAWTTSIAFWFGTTVGSQRKTNLLAQADAVK